MARAAARCRGDPSAAGCGRGSFPGRGSSARARPGSRLGSLAARTHYLDPHGLLIAHEFTYYFTRLRINSILGHHQK